MAEPSSGKSGSLNRRAVIAGLAVSFGASSLAGPAFAAEHPAIATMRKVAKDMLNAHRQGTVASFRRAIQRHADVIEIADYSLGQYRSKLPAGQKERYYGGVVTFMARYFADQSREFPIAKYEVGEASAVDGKDVEITTKVFLLSGQDYAVVWRLGWRGGKYKVTDVKVLGFSLTYMQRGIFTSFLSKRDGNVAELVRALNR